MCGWSSVHNKALHHAAEAGGWRHDTGLCWMPQDRGQGSAGATLWTLPGWWGEGRLPAARRALSPPRSFTLQQGHHRKGQGKEPGRSRGQLQEGSRAHPSAPGCSEGAGLVPTQQGQRESPALPRSAPPSRTKAHHAVLRGCTDPAGQGEAWPALPHPLPAPPRSVNQEGGVLGLGDGGRPALVSGRHVQDTDMTAGPRVQEDWPRRAEADLETAVQQERRGVARSVRRGGGPGRQRLLLQSRSWRRWTAGIPCPAQRASAGQCPAVRLRTCGGCTCAK